VGGDGQGGAAQSAAGATPPDGGGIPADRVHLYGEKPQKDRSAHSMRDLTISMLVVGLFVAFLYLIVLRPTPDPIREVDVADAASIAASTESFDILVPEGLPDGWRATSARFTPGPVDGTGTWFNGWVSPDAQFAAVSQQDYSQRDFLRQYVAGSEQTSALPVGDEVWLVFSDNAKAEWTLVPESVVAAAETADEGVGQTAVIVTGTMPPEELARFAATLQPFVR
jgi:hypothetical protein